MEIRQYIRDFILTYKTIGWGYVYSIRNDMDFLDSVWEMFRSQKTYTPKIKVKYRASSQQEEQEESGHTINGQIKSPSNIQTKSPNP